MSDPFLPDRPALAGLRPAPPVFDPVAPSLARRLSELCAATGLPGGLSAGRLRDGGDAVAGFYRVGEQAFVKLVTPRRAAMLAPAERLAHWLAGQGVPVVAAVTERPMGWGEGDLQAFVYRWVEGRFAREDAADLAALGRSLGLLHRALAVLPWADEIAAAWAARRVVLEETRERVLRHGPGPGVPEWVCAVLADTPVALDGGQPVHHDLHYANVLFDAAGQALILDFEDACHSVQPPLVDLAKVLERFVGADLAEREDGRGTVLAAAFLDAYRAVGGSDVPAADAVVSALRVQAARAVCDLVRATAQGAAPDVAEWEKFRRLHARSGCMAKLLRA